MQSGRLFEIVYILLDRGTVTAGELAKHFEVSVRTIYRDVDNLSAAGIPVYMNKGRGGGISLLPEFVLNKTVVTEAEKKEILASLKAIEQIRPGGYSDSMKGADSGKYTQRGELAADELKSGQESSILRKLGSIFGKQDTNWIEVDFGAWSDGEKEAELFRQLKEAIIAKNVVEFVYVSGKGQEMARIVEPLKVVYRSGSWYLYGYCRTREDMRFFKLKRIRKFEVRAERFERKSPERIFAQEYYAESMDMIHLKLKLDSKVAYRVYDEFEMYERQKDGSFIAEIDVPDNQWLISYIFGFGKYCEVLEPLEIRTRVENEIGEVVEKYRNNT